MQKKDNTKTSTNSEKEQQQKKNFDSYKIEFALAKSRSLCLMLLAGTSMILTYGIGLVWGQEVANSFLQFMIKWLTVVGFFLAIDWSLGELLEPVTDEAIVTKKVWRNYSKPKRQLLRFLTAACCLLLFTTGTITYWTRGEAAELLVEKPDETGLLKLAELENGNYDSKRDDINEELALARTTQDKRVADKTNEYNLKLEAHIAGGTYWQKKALSDSPKWLENQTCCKDANGRDNTATIKWRDKVYELRAERDEKVADELNKVADLEAQKSNLIFGGSAVRDTTLSKIAVALTKGQASYLSRKDAVAAAIFAVDIFLVLYIVFSTFLLGRWRNVYGKKVHSDYQGFVSIFLNYALLFRSLVASVLSLGATKMESGVKYMSNTVDLNGTLSFYAPSLSGFEDESSTDGSTADLDTDESLSGMSKSDAASSPDTDEIGQNGQSEQEKGVRQSDNNTVEFVDLSKPKDKIKKRYERAYANWIVSKSKEDRDKLDKVINEDFPEITSKGYVADTETKEGKVYWRKVRR